MDTKSFCVPDGNAVGAGRFTLMPFMWVWLRLTIMKLASRKNMMSINGMISMRARFLGIGEATCIKLVGCSDHLYHDRSILLALCMSLRLFPRNDMHKASRM